MRALALSPDGQSLFAGGDEGVITQWTVGASAGQDTVLVRELPRASRSAIRHLLVPQEWRLYSADGDRFRVWDVAAVVRTAAEQQREREEKVKGAGKRARRPPSPAESGFVVDFDCRGVRALAMTSDTMRIFAGYAVGGGAPLDDNPAPKGATVVSVEKGRPARQTLTLPIQKLLGIDGLKARDVLPLIQVFFDAE
jgi:hypothetical protein